LTSSAALVLAVGFSFGVPGRSADMFFGGFGSLLVVCHPATDQSHCRPVPVITTPSVRQTEHLQRDSIDIRCELKKESS